MDNNRVLDVTTDVVKVDAVATDKVEVVARPHNFPLNIEKCALLVIDMQNDFCHPEGFCCGDMALDATPIRAIVPQLQGVVKWAREKQMPIFWTKEVHSPDLSDVSPSKKVRYENAGYAVGTNGKRGRFLIRGEFGTQIVEELQPLPDDFQFDKAAQSVFIGSPIEAMLRKRGVSHLLICGVTTECCVLASYRQASDLGFFALLLEDCCAAYEAREHQSAIDVLLSENGALGWVGNSSDLLKL